MTTTPPVPALPAVTDLDFDGVVLGATGPVLVDFHAPWCGPCRQVAPVLERVATAMPWLRVVRLDVDRWPVTAATYRVSGLPTLVVFEAGEPVLTVVGARPERVLVRALERFAPDAPERA